MSAFGTVTSLLSIAQASGGWDVLFWLWLRVR
jgi:hypothetical protein